MALKVYYGHEPTIIGFVSNVGAHEEKMQVAIYYSGKIKQNASMQYCWGWGKINAFIYD